MIYFCKISLKAKIKINNYNTNNLQNNQQKIVLIGGPGTGKTSVLNELKNRGYYCLDEVSRAVTLQAQKEGIEQLFLTKPLLFSEMLLEGRETQYQTAEQCTENLVFFDRGIPDVYAYLNYFKTDYPDFFIKKSKQYKYDIIFHFSPWEKIHITDNERYETFENSKEIDKYLKKAYKSLGYNLINVPFDTIENRTDFIINSLTSE